MFFNKISIKKKINILNILKKKNPLFILETSSIQNKISNKNITDSLSANLIDIDENNFFNFKIKKYQK